MVIESPARVAPGADPAEDPRVELLIAEARRRARRRRWALALGVAVLLATGGIAVASLRDGEPAPGQPASVPGPGVASAFGVFEPLRGRIVYPVGDHLEAVDPTDPASVRTFAIPEVGQSAAEAPPFVPAGWSGDGTRLALTAEGFGTFVLDSAGRMTKIDTLGGCCHFVTDPWLSPGGTTAAQFAGSDHLRLRDLGSGNASRVVTLQSPVRGLHLDRPIAWSPDGLLIAAQGQVGTSLFSVHVVDVATGTVRQLVPPIFRHIRQMAWSPDGSRLLVIAEEWQPSTRPDTYTRTWPFPHENSIYLLDTRNRGAVAPSSPLPIATGYHVSATWSPDGTEIAAIDVAPRERRLLVISADGSSSRVLLHSLATGDFTGLAWHPSTGS